MKPGGLAVFDVCGTITKTNNTSDFIRFVLRKESPARYMRFVLMRLLGCLQTAFGIRSSRGRDVLRDRQIALLQGCSRDRLRDLARQYADRLFDRGLVHARILEAMQEERRRGRTIVLVSAAIDPAIEALAARLEVTDYHCSELEFAGGRCTGRLGTDLLGHKESLLDRLGGDGDLEQASVYSDNLEDRGFVDRFGTRHVILNAPEHRSWWGEPSRYRFLVQHDRQTHPKDVHSINAETLPWVYIPCLYYVFSRFHRDGVLSVFIREIVPVTLAARLFTDTGPFAWALMPLSLVIFYSVYEIGGLVNDLWARREGLDQATKRIARDVQVNILAFVGFRVILIGLVLTWLPIQADGKLAYLAALGGCLALYLVHSAIPGDRRIVTFALLKICRNSAPLIILVCETHALTVLGLCLAFSALDAPWRLYAYALHRNLVRVRLSVRRVRGLNAMGLFALGGLLYLVGRWPVLLLVASYALALECLGALRRQL
jgi:HAD superfamily phosphoserine phosphatase-like hydrolase